MAMLAGGRLQLAFQQALQMLQALGLVEQRRSRALWRSGRAGRVVAI
jgi:hypothetical protein